MKNYGKSLLKDIILHLPLSIISAIYTVKNFYISSDKCPSNLIWFLTERCNLKCSHCFVFSKNRKLRPEMESGDIIKILKTSGNKIKSIAFTGGEPLLYKDFNIIFDYVSNMQSIRNLTISTNGMLSCNLLNLLEKAKSKSVQYDVQTSLDGPPEIHNSIRGNNQAYSNLMKMLTALKEMRHNSHKNIGINLVMTVSAKNVSYVKETTLIAKELELPIVLNFVRSSQNSMLALEQVSDFRPAEHQALEIEQMNLAIADWYEVVSQFVDQKYLLPHLIRMDNIVRFRKTIQWGFPCAAGVDNAVILSDGSISICETMAPIGNIHDYGLDYSKFWKDNWQKRLRKCFCSYDCAIVYSINKSYFGNKIYFRMLKDMKKNPRVFEK